MRRLDAVCALVVPADTVADVGCDHGLVAEFCARSGMFKRVIASDISDECLNKARKALDGYADVDFYRCDGIDYECDEAVISGMGGLNISDILERAVALPKTLVLCPHRDADAVRRKVVELGYIIDADSIIEDRGRFYFVIRAQKSDETQVLSELQYMFGLRCHEPNETLRKYLTKLYNTYNVAPEQNKSKLELIGTALGIRRE